MQAANIRLHPEVYASMVGMFTLLSVAVAVPLAILGALFVSPFLLLLLILPVVVFGFLMIYPSFVGQNRAYNLESEVPYAAAYVSVMSTGGISPYKAIQRLRNVKLLPSLSSAASIMAVDVEAIGMDPVSAMESMAKALPSPDFKDLILGYASTLTVGGDIVHYLQRKAYNIFENRARNVKAIGERVTLVMETYTIVVILLALGIYILFIVSKIMPAAGSMFGTGSFVIFGYFLLPGLTVVFLFLLDMFEPRYPLADWRPYIVVAVTLPFTLVAAYLTVLPFYLQINSPLKSYVTGLASALRLNVGYAPALSLALVMAFTFLPAAIVAVKAGAEQSQVSSQLVSFLRDLVEIRKTGMAPERCIQMLSKRDYGKFSNRVQRISNKLGWGISFNEILDQELGGIKNWFVAINIFLLIDSIDVGGGTPETLEALASFGEQIQLLEKEKASTLKPLLLIPYIGGLTTLLTATVMMAYMQNLSNMAHFAFSFTDFALLFLPPVVMNTVLAGLVAGKASGEKISAGFIHAFILGIAVVVCLALMPYLTGSLALQSGT
jgi:flagellar protein FlaJ